MGGVRVSRNCLRDRFKTTENTQRNYCEFWIDCRLCEMIAHGSSTAIIFSSKGVAAKNQKVQASRSFAEARCFEFFGHQFAMELVALRCRVKILEYFAGF